MKYFLIFLLTLVLISCNEKKGYGKIRIEYGVKTTDISAKECRDANATGNTIAILKIKSMVYNLFKLISGDINNRKFRKNITGQKRRFKKLKVI